MKLMEKIALGLCALAAVICITSVKPSTAEAATKYYVTTKSSTLTKKDSAKSSKVASVPSGALVVVKDTSNKKFYKVTYDSSKKSYTGYIPKANIKKVSTMKTTAKTPLYKSGSSSSKKLTTLSKGATVYVLGTSGSYRRVAYFSGSKKYTGYISKTSAEKSTATNKYTTTNTVNMRAEPKEGSDIITRVGKGDKVKVLDNSRSSWWKVTYTNKKKKTFTGYISKRYLVK